MIIDSLCCINVPKKSLFSLEHTERCGRRGLSSKLDLAEEVTSCYGSIASKQYSLELFGGFIFFGLGLGNASFQGGNFALQGSLV